MDLRKHDRRSFLKYLIGGVIAVFATAGYIRLRSDSSTKKETTTQRQSTTSRSKVPPGQYETEQLEVLHVGAIPNFDPQTWNFEILGVANRPLLLSWDKFKALAKTESMSDFHCVTGWSKLENRWIGVSFRTIHEMVEPRDSAKYATIVCDGDYTTSLPLNELLDDDVLFAYELDGKPLDPRYGGPLRLVVSKKYAYKSAKWVRKVRFTEQQELGYWEVRGYSNTADPWSEDRYSR